MYLYLPQAANVYSRCIYHVLLVTFIFCKRSRMSRGARATGHLRFRESHESQSIGEWETPYFLQMFNAGISVLGTQFGPETYVTITGTLEAWKCGNKTSHSTLSPTK